MLHSIADKLTAAVLPMGSVAALGTRAAGFTPYGADRRSPSSQPGRPARRPRRRLLAAYVDDETTLRYRRLRVELADADRAGAGAPGVLRLGDHRCGGGRADCRPRRAAAATRGRRRRPARRARCSRSSAARPARRSPTSACSREPSGPETGCARRASEAQGHRDQRLRPRVGRPARLGRRPGRSASCGVWATSRSATRSASRRRPRRQATTSRRRRWRRSSCPSTPRDRGALHAALTQLAEQDPLINLRQDEIRREISGLALRRGAEGGHPGDAGQRLRHRRRRSARPRPSASSGRSAPAPPSRSSARTHNPFLATVGLRVEPAPLGTGVAFRLGGRARRDAARVLQRRSRTTVRETLQQGLHGWEVTDCMVTMTHSGYAPRQSHAHATFDKSMSSTAGDFRNLTRLVLMAALQRGRHPRVRADAPLPARAPGRHARTDAARAGPACAPCRARRCRPARRTSLDGRDPGSQGARADPTAAGAHPRRGRAGVSASTATSRSAARSRAGRGPTTIR